MKLKTPYKTVMFYGNILRINARANWLAVNEDGTMTAFMEEPHVSYGGWDVKSGAIWNLDARAELEGEDWKDTLTYCPRDQQWMIAAVGKLDVAHFLYGDDTAHKAMSRTIDVIADLIRRKTADWDLRDTFKVLMTHATPPYLQASPVTEMLRDKLFPKPKEPEYRVVKDYYGRDIIVPPWARWIAMDQDGEAVVFMDAPNKEDRWWRRSNYENPRIAVAWFPRHIAKSSWHDSLREVQP